jgi:hypothetical protein
MPNVNTLSVVMLNAIMLSVIMLNVIMLGVVMLSVVAQSPTLANSPGTYLNGVSQGKLTEGKYSVQLTSSVGLLVL